MGILSQVRERRLFQIVLAYLAALFPGCYSIGVNGKNVRRFYTVFLATAGLFALVFISLGFGVPLAFGSLVTGIVQSLGTPWGLIRHYWVALKLVITAFSTVILLIYMATFRQMAGVAADPVVELGLVRNASPLLHASPSTPVGNHPVCRDRLSVAGPQPASWPLTTIFPSPRSSRRQSARHPRSPARVTLPCTSLTSYSGCSSQ
jgi:hypothetical protein